MQFAPEQKVINDLFGNDLSYNIPSYQRPYSWSARGTSDKDNQVNTMWDDLIDHFENSNREDIYFMGSMVLIGNTTSREFEVVDGQQRLTTLALLFVAINCMLQRMEDGKIDQRLNGYKGDVHELIETLLYNRKRFGAKVREKKVRIQNTVGFNYDRALTSALECESLDKSHIKEASEEEIEVFRRYFLNRDYFIERLEDRFLVKGYLSYENGVKLDDFIGFLKNRVNVVRILAPSFEVAYHIFETLNNRGLPLSNKDLFRNFMISKLYAENVEHPEKKWLTLDDYELTSQFISRYVESTTGRKQRFSAFNDLKAIFQERFTATRTEKQIIAFYKDIERNLENYTNIERLSFESKEIKYRVATLMQTNNSTHIRNILLSLFRNVQTEKQQVAFLKNLELYMFYVLLVPAVRFSQKHFFTAINNLNDADFDSALVQFALSDHQRKALRTVLLEGVIKGKDNDRARLLLARYFWGKRMNSDEDVAEIELIFKRATLEHIIPQNPKPNSLWKTEFSRAFLHEFTYKIGNMTLLTGSINSSISNADFGIKKSAFAKTYLPMTRELADLPELTEDFLRQRHECITTTLVEQLGLT